MPPQRTVLHLVRHGEVFNPAGVLYGRLPDYHLSDVGREMAERVAQDLGERDIVHLRCSPLERAQDAAYGHEAVIVSHQLPIWMARCNAEGRRLIHDPRRRDCSLASVTSFSYLDGRIASVAYREPAADLLRGPAKKKSVAGA